MIKNIDSTIRHTSEQAVAKIGNRYDLVLVAAQRVRELQRGDSPLTQRQQGPITTVLSEIEQGLVGRERLRHNNAYKKSERKHQGTR